jgi:DNA replication and repair protein RecF
VRLAWIEARDFRNYREVSMEVPTALTAVVGPNGQGKTNLLEAMYYLLALESPRVSSDLPLVRQGAASAFLRGEAEASGGRFLIEVEVRAGGQNRVQVNRSPVRRKRDLRRHVRAVFSGPDDLRVVEGDPDQRRRFMDEAARALWPAREGSVAAYDRALRQRNRMLKDWDGRGEPPGMAGWDAELIVRGAALTAVRAGAVARIRPGAAEEFRALSGEPLGVAYRPSVAGEWDQVDPGDRAALQPLEEAFRSGLASRREDELVRRTTLVGPHRDDLALEVQGLAARGFASHGEASGAAVSLRLAEGRAVAAEAGEEPALFLDDPFSALDPERRRRLASELPGRGQVLLAVPDEAQVPADATLWRVKEGAVAPE